MNSERRPRRRKRPFLWAISGVVAVLVVVFGLCWPFEPRLEGRLLSALLVDLVSSEQRTRDAATEVIRKHASAVALQCLPFLRERKSLLLPLIYKSTKTTLWMREWFPGLERRGQIEMGAFRALCSLGPQAKPAVPYLIEMLSAASAETRRRAAGVLGAIGQEAEDAVPQLCVLVRDPHPHVRLMAARSLGAIGPAAKSPIYSLVGALHSDDKRLAAEAATALGKFGGGAQDTIPSLLMLLQEADWTQVRSANPQGASDHRRGNSRS